MAKRKRSSKPKPKPKEVAPASPTNPAPVPQPPIGVERDRNAARMRESRAKSRVVEIPKCEDPKRRARLEKNIFKWLPWYAQDPYGEYGFTDQIRTIINDLLRAYTDGEDQADAASRGEGKTTASEWVEVFLALQGKSPCAILFEATSELAEASLDAIRERLETNDRLAADYPEICIPVRSLEQCAQRARTQLVSGWRHDNGQRFENAPSHFKWTGRDIILPHVPGAPGSGSVIAARGLEKAVRGIKFGGRAIRPTIAIINDPETEESARNPDQVMKLEERIERGIGGLGGQRKELGRVILTTVQRKGSLSDRYTDPAIKQSFKGRRFRFLVKPPDRLDLWEEYVQLKLLDWANKAEGKETTLAFDFYRKHRRAMDAGAVVANPNRRPGGQLSGLQFYYDFVARKGADAAASELDNDPPEESGPVESGITALHIQRRVNGLARGIVPSGCTALVRGIDCRKAVLHWVVRAARPDGTAFTIDYGERLTRGTAKASDDGIDLALRRALRELIDSTKERPYRRADGEIVPIKLTLVDSGYRASAIYQACRECGMGIMPAKGYGKSNGCAAPNFSEAQKATRDKTPGDGWFITRAGPPGEQVNLVHMDTDRWKAFEHDRWMTEAGQPGALSIFGQPSENPGYLSHDQKEVWPYARQIVAEVEAEEIRKGALHRFWKQINPNNHWLDASYMSDVASNVCGIKLLPSIEAQQQRLGPAVQMAGMPESHSGRPIGRGSGARGGRAW
jgi:hypothetical protein